MDYSKVYDQMLQKFQYQVQIHDLLKHQVCIQARGLSVEEAIGNPEGDDFPLQKGKEKLMQANFAGALGQAFTDRYGNYEGTLQEVLGMQPSNNYRRALLVSTMNAVLRHLSQADRTIHCRDQEPSCCAQQLSEYIRSRYGAVKVGQVGFQPRMVDALAQAFDYRITDMDPDNIQTVRYGTLIEGPETTEEMISWADVLVVTGTTLVNGTIGQFLWGKPAIFYGTTIAGAAELMGLERFCACAK